MRSVLAALGLAVCMGAAHGADAPPSDVPTSDVPTSGAPATLPNLDFTPTPTDEHHYDDYFYFHKDGVRFETALADVKECEALSHVSSQPVTPLPTFIPIGGATVRNDNNKNALLNAFFMWGIAGGVMGAILLDDMETDMSNSNLRRCMGYHGYKRYGTTRKIWKTLSRDTLDILEQRLATIASGPAPTHEAIAP